MTLPSDYLFVKNKNDICYLQAKHYSGSENDNVMEIGVLGPEKREITRYQSIVFEEPSDSGLVDTCSIGYKKAKTFVNLFPDNIFLKVRCCGEIVYVRKSFVYGLFTSFDEISTGTDYFLNIQLETGDILKLFYDEKSFWFLKEQTKKAVEEISNVNGKTLNF